MGDHGEFGVASAAVKLTLLPDVTCEKLSAVMKTCVDPRKRPRPGGGINVYTYPQINKEMVLFLNAFGMLRANIVAETMLNGDVGYMALRILEHLVTVKPNLVRAFQIDAYWKPVCNNLFPNLTKETLQYIDLSGDSPVPLTSPWRLLTAVGLEVLERAVVYSYARAPADYAKATTNTVDTLARRINVFPRQIDDLARISDVAHITSGTYTSASYVNELPFAIGVSPSTQSSTSPPMLLWTLDDLDETTTPTRAPNTSPKKNRLGQWWFAAGPVSKNLGFGVAFGARIADKNRGLVEYTNDVGAVPWTDIQQVSPSVEVFQHTFSPDDQLLLDPDVSLFDEERISGDEGDLTPASPTQRDRRAQRRDFRFSRTTTVDERGVRVRAIKDDENRVFREYRIVKSKTFLDPRHFVSDALFQRARQDVSWPSPEGRLRSNRIFALVY